jgi:MFS transporter, MHS family, proline/betaine transporter
MFTTHTFGSRRRRTGGAMTARNLSALGTTLEWYDFALYLYLAPVLAGLFFPSHGGLSALLATFAVFAVSYFMRPVGALFFGQLGDRLGRRAALIASLSLMIAPMIVIGVLPTWSAIGIAAPILLVAMRMAQGFSVGGEFSGTLVLMSESSEDKRRGVTSGIAMSAVGLGLLLASGMAALLHTVLTSGQLHAYGWRIGFLVGAAIGVVALVMRARMPETAAFAAAREAGKTEKHPTVQAFKRHPRQMLSVFAMTGFAGIAGYMTITWLPSFLQTTIHAGATDALVGSALGSIVLIVLSPVAGRVADRIGRRPVMAAAAGCLAVLAYPLFVLVAAPAFWRIAIGTMALMTLVTWYLGGFSATIAELFPTETRYSGVCVSYNLAQAVFSGTTPLLATALVHLTGWNMAPAMYLIAAALGVLVVLSRLPETRGVSLTRGRSAVPVAA